MKSLNLAEALAVPLYNAMTPNPGNSTPYNAIVPSVNMTQTNAKSPANFAATRGLDLEGTDQVPQEVLDRMLWHYRHGFHSQPPPPGPNASTQDSKGADAGSINRKAIVRQIRRAMQGKSTHLPPGVDLDG
jgi:hypothetical protein